MTFALEVEYSDGYVRRYNSIKKIERAENGVLIYYPENGINGWVYVFDGGTVVKSWGHYSNQEFLVRAKELNIQNSTVYDVNEYWTRE